MSPQFRTAALIAASLGLLVSLYLALSRGGDDGTTPSTSAAVRITVSVPGDQPPTVKHFNVKQGRRVVFVVTSELADEVHLHGYDLSANVAPGEPATIRFKATAPGLFEAELESRSLPIAELEVRP